MKKKITSTEEPKEIIDPVVYAMSILTEINPMGGNDHEYSTVLGYIQQYKQKKISGPELIARMDQIKEAKQQADYH